LHALQAALFVAAWALGSLVALGQAPPRPVDAAVHFDQKLQDWDGFGVNYVEVTSTRDYKQTPQEYGGFSTLSEKKRQEILELIFGPDGLKPGTVKMFLDPFHEGMTEAEKGKFDHETTTKWMRYFVREGLKMTRARGGDLQIMTCLYGPPAWATKQKFMRGRDLDPREKEDLAQYMIEWVKYLRDHEKFPVKYISLNNEGDGFNRWPVDGSAGGDITHDYNLWWPPSQIVDFLRFMRPMMDRQGLQDVGLTPGETSKWENFGDWYAYSIYSDPLAMKNIGLITSHDFAGPLGPSSTSASLGVELLHLTRPDLHVWTTSTPMEYGGLTHTFVERVRLNIYNVKVNSLIPWSIVQSRDWVGEPGGYMHVGTGIWVDRKGGYKVDHDYNVYKQLTRAGQPGMAVAKVSSSDPSIGLIAFARNGTQNPDALVVNNLAEARGNVMMDTREVAIRITGTQAQTFDVYATGFYQLDYEPMGTVTLRDGVLKFAVPNRSVVTFFARQ
jgi:hypothetical protein